MKVGVMEGGTNSRSKATSFGMLLLLLVTWFDVEDIVWLPGVENNSSVFVILRKEGAPWICVR